MKKSVKNVVKVAKGKSKIGKFEKFDKAEKEIKDAKNSVVDIGSDLEEGAAKSLITKAAMDLERAEAEVEEADEDCF